MNTKAYPIEKRKIIASRPFEDLMAFSMGIAPQLLDNFIKKLPPIQGFRKGTHNELLARLKRFLRRAEVWSDADWSMFNDLWLDWTKTHPNLDEVLSQFDNTCDFELEKLGVPPNSELDIKCFEFLSAKSGEARISKELINNFYEYGYFLVDPIIEQYISIAKSSEELELFKLPDRIKKIEDATKNVEAISSTINQRFESAEKIHEYETKRINRMESQLTVIQENINKLDVINKNLAETIDQALRGLVKYDSNFNEVEERFNGILKTNESKYEIFEKELLTHIGTQKQFNQDLKVLEQKLYHMESLLEERERVGTYNKDNDSTPMKITERFVPLNVERLTFDGSPRKLDNYNSIASMLTDGLRSIGMQSLAAQVISNEFLAALSVGQLVFFIGSIASTVAMICARSLSGTNCNRIRIPIGLTDSNEFDKAFVKVLESTYEKETICALIIEGMNFSAPEAYASRLRQLITERFLGLNPMGQNLIIIATLVDGSSALDIPQELCQWGPVFHTDCIEWRDKWTSRNIESGYITSQDWAQFMENSQEPSEEWEDLFTSFSSIGGLSTILQRRALYLAASALNKEEVSIPSVPQSLAFGWLLPYSFAAGIDLADFDELVTEIQANAQKKDDRLTKFLELFTKVPRDL